MIEYKLISNFHSDKSHTRNLSVSAVNIYDEIFYYSLGELFSEAEIITIVLNLNLSENYIKEFDNWIISVKRDFSLNNILNNE